MTENENSRLAEKEGKKQRHYEALKGWLFIISFITCLVMWFYIEQIRGINIYSRGCVDINRECVNIFITLIMLAITWILWWMDRNRIITIVCLFIQIIVVSSSFYFALLLGFYNSFGCAGLRGGL